SGDDFVAGTPPKAQDTASHASRLDDQGIVPKLFFHKSDGILQRLRRETLNPHGANSPSLPSVPARWRRSPCMTPPEYGATPWRRAAGPRGESRVNTE